MNNGECKYGKDFMKIKFDSDNNLQLSKSLNLPLLTIIVRSILKMMVDFILKFI